MEIQAQVLPPASKLTLVAELIIGAENELPHLTRAHLRNGAGETLATLESPSAVINSHAPLQSLLRAVMASAAGVTQSGARCRLPPRYLREIQEHVDANLDAPLSVIDLSGRIGISPSHFSRCFRQSVGMPPHRYVMQRRVLRAKQLLTQTSLPLSEIALAAGFSDQSHFSRHFHRQTGVPPRAFRRQQVLA